jgi:hypothetical protein
VTTFILNDRYDVTLAGPSKTPKGYEVEGKIGDRKSGKATDKTPYSRTKVAARLR